MDKIHLGKSERKNSVFCSLSRKNSLCYYPLHTRSRAYTHTDTNIERKRRETEIRVLKYATQGFVNKIQWFMSVCACARVLSAWCQAVCARLLLAAAMTHSLCFLHFKLFIQKAACVVLRGTE